jgi:hypothetical protein
MNARGSDGYLICAVRGCNEPAQPWAILLPLDDDSVEEIEVLLCSRHEHELVAPTMTAEVEP